MKVAICDDEQTDIQYLKRLVGCWASERGLVVQTDSFESAESFLFTYEEDKSFDILLLDIQMKAMDGVALAKQIRKENETVQIVFITGFPDFLAEGYEVSALHYLMKPVSTDKLFSVLDKAQKNLNKTEKSLLVTLNGETHRIPFHEIIFVEVQGHYISIHTAAETYKTKMNLSDIQTTLGDGFFRCQRSFIVNLKYVHKITRTAIVMDGTMEIPLSRELYDAANQAIIKFFP